jgi:hypothetical protein
MQMPNSEGLSIGWAPPLHTGDVARLGGGQARHGLQCR